MCVYIYIYIILTSWRGWRLLVAPPVWVCIKRPWYRQVIRHIKNLCISNHLLRILHWKMGVLTISIICVLILSVYTIIYYTRLILSVYTSILTISIICFFLLSSNGQSPWMPAPIAEGELPLLDLDQASLMAGARGAGDIFGLKWMGNGWEMGEIHV